MIGATNAGRDRARGALLGTFVGDALGMPFEGAPPEAIPERLEMREARLGQGTYTDDTQMMIALAESILDAHEVNEHHLAGAFLAAYDPHRGYGAGTRQVFELWRRGRPVDAAATEIFDSQGSLGNGAAMRVAPVAVRGPHSSTQLMENARKSARVTHAHPVGVDAAVVLAHAIAAALCERDVLSAASTAAATSELRNALEVTQRLLVESPSPAEVARQLGNSSIGHRSVPATIYAAVAHDSFRATVQFAVRCGGDTDTIAAMAGAIAGARHGASSVPADWLDDLENEERGRDHVIQLADELRRQARADALVVRSQPI